MKVVMIRFLILTLSGLLLSSCTSLLYTSLDILRPAKVVFEPDAANLLIVNNSVIQPSNFGHKNLLLNERPKNISVATDSLAIYCLSALKEELEEKNFFTSVQLIPYSLNNTTDFIAVSQLNEDSVRHWCDLYQANAILSLNKIKVNDVITEFTIGEPTTFLATLELNFDSYWSIHYPTKKEISTIQFKDSMYWESESFSRKKALNELPDRKDALIDGALNVGQKTVARLVPYWEKVDRFFYNPKNKYIRQGMDSVYVKNWQAAINCWEKSIDKNNSLILKAQALNNIAVAYEISGNMEKALDAAMSSLNYFSQQLFIVDYESIIRISNYIAELKTRKSEIELLKLQLGEK